MTTRRRCLYKTKIGGKSLSTDIQYYNTHVISGKGGSREPPGLDLPLYVYTSWAGPNPRITLLIGLGITSIPRFVLLQDSVGPI